MVTFAQQENYDYQQNEGWGIQLQSNLDTNDVHFNFMGNYIHNHPNLPYHQRFIWYFGYESYNRKHSDVRGSGWGLGFSWRHYLKHPKGSFIGVRGDIWQFNSELKQSSVNSSAFVFRPAGVIGITFKRKHSFDLTLSLARDINLDSSSEIIYSEEFLLLFAFEVHFD